MQKIRTAIIGLGNITHGYDDVPGMKSRITYPTHLSVLKKDKRFQLVAASDISVSARRAFQKKIPRGVALYADFRSMLKSEAIDLLVVAVPTEHHYAVCSDALALGIKNMLCEKPITRTLKEAEKLRALSKRHKARILVNYQRSYSRELTRPKARPSSIAVQYNNGVFNTATHAIHLLEKLFGPINSVQSAKRSVRGSTDPNISFIAYARGRRVLFEGVDGLEYRLFEIDMKFTKERVILHSNSFASTSMRDVYENAYQVIMNNKKPVADLASSIHALAVAERAVESAKNGKFLKV